jgi:metal-dependent hydrolase (beta-lactamase superfamily II)
MTTEAGAAKITIVVDNRADQGLLYEHGFSG